MDDSGDSDAFVDVDLLIIGAGPAGLFGAYYAGFRELRVAIMDALPEPGGQISSMYPEKMIYDIAGFPAVKGRDLISRLFEQASRFSPIYRLGERATTLRKIDGADGGAEFEVTADSGAVVRSRAVIITGGIGAFTPRKLIAAAGYEGRGLAYFVPEVADYLGRDVVIVGGGDSAFDWAQTLQPLARSVVMIHRRDTFRAHAATITQVKESSVELVTNAQVIEVTGGDAVDGVVVAGAGVEGQRRLPCQRLVAALGFVADLGPLRSWDLEIVQNRHIVVDSSMQTNVPGVFAAGDITDYPGKVRLIAVGFGEVATAVNNAAVYINPGSELFPGHSTDAVSSAAPQPVG